ncbi:MAG: hypothetical protein MUP44_03560 [Anaerolineales bacterium]|nr:hypothetical protein [Anaerolineales bacterium]
MTFATLFTLLAKYGPSIIPIIQNIRLAIAAGRENEVVSDADWIELDRLARQSAEDIYRRLGITPPPTTPVVPETATATAK